MQQLSGVDASFLNMETTTSFGHVASMNVYDPKGAPGGGGYEVTRALILERMDQLAPFRRRLVQVPLGLDLPYWVEDPEFDIDFHVRQLALPSPGSDEQLAEQVARIVSRPLDRSRPLWELYVIEGLSGGRIAQLTKIHHATIDGASGAQMLADMLETDPKYRPSGDVATWPSERIPSDAQLLQKTALEFMRRPEKMVRLNVRMLRQLASSTRSGGLKAMADMAAQPLPGPLGDALRQRLRGGNEVDTPPALPPTPAPRTPFNRSITPHRRFAFTSIPLAEAKTVKNKLGTTFNDVVMALCSATLRRYLEERDVLPEDPLIAMVPVSIRSGDEGDAYQNRVSGMLCNLATDEKDPVERLMRIHGSMNSAKEMHAAIPAELLQDYTLFAPPAIAARAMRMYARTRIADRMNPPFNLIISNVPGPNEPLYSAGAKLLHFYPVSAVVDGQGLNMTVQSYNGSLDFGFISCRELVPDLWDMTGYLEDAMQELLDSV
jgi:WS/DGAT/MGAT family acyltransferase